MLQTQGLIDFHCHLDLYPDHVAAVQEAETAGVFTLAVTTTPKAWPRNHELTRGTKHVRAVKLPLEMGVLSFVQNVDKELRNGGKASTCGIHAGI